MTVSSLSSTSASLLDQLADVDAATTSPTLEHDLRDFRWDGRATSTAVTTGVTTGKGDSPRLVDTYINEFWTSRQRAAHSLHEVSYRACFKPQLPRFFIERLTRPGDVVYDPFMGRGTTVLEAALLGRRPAGNDANPLSRMLVEPRLRPPTLAEVRDRLAAIDWTFVGELPDELLTFYHPETLREVCALKQHLDVRARATALDDVDRWIRMVAVNRLTGHSTGFFSVYTLPPNQAASVPAQRKINADRGQQPPRRHVAELIVRKSRSLLTDVTDATRAAVGAHAAQLLTGAAQGTPDVATGSVDLVVTSPPFLDIVNYAGDNWLRCWFCGIDAGAVQLSILKRIEDWREAMTDALRELTRVLRPGGHVAFEVGEVRRGQIRLEEHVIPCGVSAGLEPRLVLINAQQFTKTAACWGVDNNAKGTNTNRVVLFRRT